MDKFLQLVQIDSTSGNERQIADVLAEELKQLGLSVYEDTAGKNVGTSTGNLIAHLPGNVAGAPVLMFSSHMDTVEPGENIRPQIKDGIIYSSGDTVLGGDDKAGLAAILEALYTIKENNLPHGDLKIIFTIWEEGGLVGSTNIEQEHIKADAGFVLDSNGDPGSIVVRGPSQDQIVATIKGKAAHAGINPQDGINAIQVASKAVASMKLGKIDNDTTANIGVISGGKATNIVPEEAVVHGETRSMDREKRAAQTESICFAFKQAAKDEGASVDIQTETIYPDIDLKENEPVVELATLAARNIRVELDLTSTGGGSDANNFNYYGIPTVNLGIGMKQVHTTSEYITIENLILSARYVTEIIRTGAQNQG